MRKNPGIFRGDDPTVFLKEAEISRYKSSRSTFDLRPGRRLDITAHSMTRKKNLVKGAFLIYETSFIQGPSLDTSFMHQRI